jgi:repressor LexA
MLTKKQYQLLTFIDGHLKTNGVSPSFDEMKAALGLKSKSGIHRLITGLGERGFLKRLPHRARALKVLMLPENQQSKAADPQPPQAATRFSPNVIQGDFKLSGAVVAEASEAVDIPLYGRIAAGTPIEAFRDNSNTIGIPASLLGKGEHYALEIDGESMIEAGIHDGDTAIIERCDTADNGTIVVALIDDNEVTLKRLRRKGNSIALEPANGVFETRIFGPDRVQVQGKLVGLMRKY